MSDEILAKKLSFEHTLQLIAKQQELYREQARWLEYFQENLKKCFLDGSFPVWMEFVVSMPKSSDEQIPVRVESSSLGAAYQKAVDLWSKFNDTSRKSADCFIKINDQLLPLVEQDAVAIIQKEMKIELEPHWLKLDSRLIGVVGKTVWPIKDNLPGHHAPGPIEDELDSERALHEGPPETGAVVAPQNLS